MIYYITNNQIRYLMIQKTVV